MKKILTTALSFILALSVFSTAYAASKENYKPTIGDIMKLSEKHPNVSIAPLDNSILGKSDGLSESDKNRLLKFDTIEDFEKFVEQQQNSNEISIELSDNLVGEQKSELRSSEGNDVISYSNPTTVLGGYGCKLHMDINYNYNNINGHRAFTRINSISTSIVGFDVLSKWTQDTYTCPISTTRYTSDTVSGKVYGVMLLGVSIGGFEVGYSYPETISYKYVMDR